MFKRTFPFFGIRRTYAYYGRAHINPTQYQEFSGAVTSETIFPVPMDAYNRVRQDEIGNYCKKHKDLTQNNIHIMAFTRI